MKKWFLLFLALVCLLTMAGCGQKKTVSEEKTYYTYEELESMPADELLDLFIENGLVINDELKASFTEEELQILFKEGFHYWHTGICPMSWTPYFDLAKQAKAVYDKIAVPKE